MIKETQPTGPPVTSVPSRKGQKQGCFNQKREQPEVSAPSNRAMSNRALSFRGKPLEIEQPSNDAQKEVPLAPPVEILPFLAVFYGDL